MASRGSRDGRCPFIPSLQLTALADDQLDALTQALPGYGGITHDGQTLTARMTVQAATLRVAADEALKAARSAHAEAVGAPGAPTQIRVLPDEARAAELTRPAPLDLVGLREIGEILGLSNQRGVQLANTHPGFPAPVANLASGRVYTRASVEATPWRRPPGRQPRRSAPDEDA